MTYVPPDAIKAVVAALRADGDLVTLLDGTHIYKTRTRKEIRTPGVYWSRVSTKTSENEIVSAFQFDIFASDVETCFLIEARLYALLHHDTPVTIGSVTMWSWLEEAHDEDDRDDTELEGVQRNTVKYRFTQIREETQ